MAVDYTVLSGKTIAIPVKSVYGCVTNSKGHILASSRSTHQIHVFDPKGNLLASFGSQGSNDAQFINPYFVTVDDLDQIYVSDYSNHRIQVLDPSGNFLFKFGGSGSADGQLTYPTGIAVNSQKEIVVADNGNNRVQVFDSKGNFICKFGSKGSDNGCFSSPYALTIGNNDSICAKLHWIYLKSLSLQIVIIIRCKCLTIEGSFSSNLDQMEEGKECFLILKESATCQ